MVEERLHKPGERDDSLPTEFRPTEADIKVLRRPALSIITRNSVYIKIIHSFILFFLFKAAAEAKGKAAAKQVIYQLHLNHICKIYKVHSVFSLLPSLRNSLTHPIIG